MNKYVVLVSLVFLPSLFLRGQTACLFADYRLDGNAADSASNAIHGSINGSIPDIDRNGNANSSMFFDGIDDRIEIPSNFDFKHRSVTLWFKADTITPSISNFYNSDFPGLNYGMTTFNTIEIGGIDYLRYNAGGASSSRHDEPISEKIWYHAGLSFGPDSVHYYLNCELVATVPRDTIASISGSADTRLGCGRFNSNFFKGWIDEIKVYDCELDGTDMCDTLIENGDSITSVNQEINSNGRTHLNIFPNPTSNQFTLQFDQTKSDITLEIRDFSGRTLLREEHQEVKSITKEMNLSPGVYLVSVSYGDGKLETQKLIIE